MAILSAFVLIGWVYGFVEIINQHYNFNIFMRGLLIILFVGYTISF